MEAHLCENNSYEGTNPLHFTFKTINCPPQHKDLIQFENNIIELIESFTFRKFHNKNQNTFQKDINFIKMFRNLFIFASKTQNIYETDKGVYLKLLNDNITKTYRKLNNTVYKKINKGKVNCK